jgi:hypothetical protein
MTVDSTSSPAIERPNDSDASSSYDAGRTEQPATPQPGSEDTRGQRRAEPMTREEYADSMREDGPPLQDSRDDHQVADGNESHPQTDTQAELSADHEPAGTHDHEARDTGTHADSAVPEPAVRAVAEPLTREEYADAMRGNGPAVTHFHGEFKGRPLDLYTDGTRWAAADTPDTEETVGEKGDLPDLLPTGKELVDNADEGSSLLERLRREVYEESDGELDFLEKEANLIHDVFSRPPTGSHEGTSPNQPYIHRAQPSGIDAGSVATAVFTLGLVIDRTARWVMQHYENRTKGR